MSNHLSLQQDPSRWGKGQSAATQFCFHSQKLVFDLPPSHLSYEPGCCSSQPSALRSPPPSPGAAPGRGSPPSLVQQTPTERREHSDASAEPGCPVEGQFLSRPPAERAGQEGAFLPALLPVTMPANQLCGGFTSKLNFHILQHCAYLQNLLSQHTHTILHSMLGWTKRMCHPEFFLPFFLGGGTSLQPLCSLGARPATGTASTGASSTSNWLQPWFACSSEPMGGHERQAHK